MYVLSYLKKQVVIIATMVLQPVAIPPTHKLLSIKTFYYSPSVYIGGFPCRNDGPAPVHQQ
jgi:hypothetical protein